MPDNVCVWLETGSGTVNVNNSYNLIEWNDAKPQIIITLAGIDTVLGVVQSINVTVV